MLRVQWKAVREFVEASRMHAQASDVLLAACPSGLVSELAHVAVYHAGYQVECILKARWLSEIRPKRHPVALAVLKRAVGHDIEKLLDRLGQLRKPVTVPPEIARAARTIRRYWSSEMRYSAKPYSATSARKLREAAEEVSKWCER